MSARSDVEFIVNKILSGFSVTRADEEGRQESRTRTSS